MTVTSTTSRMDYPGTGSTGPFAYTFRIYTGSDLLVTKVDAAGLETTLTYPSDFSLTGINTRSGGNLTLTIALEVGENLTIRRVRPLTQLLNLRNQGATFPANVEDGLDQNVMLAQQLYNDVLASVHLAETTDPADFDTALPANMSPGDAIVVNAGGTGFSMAALTAAQLTAWNAAQNMRVDAFTSGFTPGVTTSLTLTANPGNENNVTVSMRVSGTVRLFERDEYDVSGTTLTFVSPIPAGTTRVEVTYLYTYQVNTADAANVTWNQAGAGSAGRTVSTKLREIISIYDFGAVGDGTTDDTAALVAANVYASSVQGTITFPAGRFSITDNVSISSDVALDFMGGGTLVIATGKTVTIAGPIDAPIRVIFDADGSTGTAAFTASDHAPHITFPEWWGALGDGSTDDGPAIQRATIASAPIGAEVRFSATTYMVTTQIAYLTKTAQQPGLRWRGAGNRSTTLINNVDAAAMLKVDANDDLTPNVFQYFGGIADLEITGTGGSATTTAAMEINGWWFPIFENLLIQNLPNDGVLYPLRTDVDPNPDFSASTNNTYIQCYILTNGGVGLNALNSVGVPALTFEGGFIGYNEKGGMVIGGAGLTIRDGTSFAFNGTSGDNTQYPGLHLQRQDGASGNGAIIMNAEFDGNKCANIKISGYINVTMIGVSFKTEKDVDPFLDGQFSPPIGILEDLSLGGQNIGIVVINALVRTPATADAYSFADLGNSGNNQIDIRGVYLLTITSNYTPLANIGSGALVSYFTDNLYQSKIGLLNVLARNTGGGNCPGAAGATFAYDSQVVDSHACFDPTTYTVTIPFAGRFWVHARVTISGSVAGDRVQLQIRQGVSVAHQTTGYAAGALAQSYDVCGLVDAALADAVTIFMTSTTAQAITTGQAATALSVAQVS